jgi:hypothetical protein
LTFFMAAMGILAGMGAGALVNAGLAMGILAGMGAGALVNAGLAMGAAATGAAVGAWEIALPAKRRMLLR